MQRRITFEGCTAQLFCTTVSYTMWAKHYRLKSHSKATALHLNAVQPACITARCALVFASHSTLVAHNISRELQLPSLSDLTHGHTKPQV